MLKILLVKTSSLGDVVSNLPVVTDIVAAHPGARIDWLVEEAFADIAHLHPRVHHVLPVALRRWKKQLCHRTTWRELRALRHTLAREDYDFVIDTQGLIKSAWLTRMARGIKCGYDRASIREPLASFAYDRRFAVSWQQHAVARNRALAAAALDYEIDAQSTPDYGLGVTPSRPDWLPHAPYEVLLTATSRDEKLWPEAHWVALARARGVPCVLPAGNALEAARAQRIAQAVPGALVAPAMGLNALAHVLAGARAVVGVDTGLTHLAAAIGRPVVGLYVGSSPAANGVIAQSARNLGAPGAPPTVAEVEAALAQLTA